MIKKEEALRLSKEAYIKGMEDLLEILKFTIEESKKQLLGGKK